MRTIITLILCFLPLGLTPLFGYLLAEGWVNLGGGEKDLLMLIPWLIWSLTFSIVFIVFWVKKRSLQTIIIYAVTAATALLFILWLGLFLYTFQVLDYVTLGCLIGLVVFGYLWRKSSPETLYHDSDGDPVSWKSIFGLLWIMCLVILIASRFTET